MGGGARGIGGTGLPRCATVVASVGATSALSALRAEVTIVAPAWFGRSNGSVVNGGAVCAGKRRQRSILPGGFLAPRYPGSKLFQ